MTKKEQERLRATLPPRCTNGKWNRYTPAQEKLYYKLEWISYIDSCFCYGQEYVLERHFHGDKHREYYSALTDQEMRDIMNEHLEYLKANAEIRCCVGHDSEGNSYNSLRYK